MLNYLYPNLQIKLIRLTWLKGKTIGEARLRLWYHLCLILKKLSRSFMTNILSICTFIGLVRFEDKDFRKSLFIFKIFSLFAVIFLLFIAIFVIIIIATVFMVVITIFIFIYLFLLLKLFLWSNYYY